MASEDSSRQKYLRTSRRCQRLNIKSKGRTQSRDRSRTSDKNSLSSNEGLNEVSEEIYLVEDIRGERIVKGQKFYKVRWQGFPPEADSWEPEENLSNVLDIIADFHQRSKNTANKSDALKDYSRGFENSPASAPTPPTTPGSTLSNSRDRSRGASEERQVNNSGKRRHVAKSRSSGRFEYIPKHELVAVKTKYFDDIRDGKIDLSSNDLYSRVKTRKRFAVEAASTVTSTDSANSRSGSVHGEMEIECDQSLETNCSMKREPCSPSSSCFNMCDSFGIYACTPNSADSEQSKVSGLDKIDGSLSDEITSLSEPVSNRIPNNNCSNEGKSIATQYECELPHGVPKATSCDLFNKNNSTVDVALSPITFPSSPSLKPAEANMTDPNSQPSTSSNSSFDLPKLTVSSLRALVNIYFTIIESHLESHHLNANLDPSSKSETADLAVSRTGLDRLPELCSYNSQARIRTCDDFLEAVHTNHWSLLTSALTKDFLNSSSGPTNKLTEPHRKSSNPDSPSGPKRDHSIQDILVACVVGGAGRPAILDLLADQALDPTDLIDPSSKWPLVALATVLGRLQVCQTLLDLGASPNCVEPGPRRRTALGLAISAGDTDMANMLILAGANLYEVEPGVTALNMIMNLIQASSSSSSNLGNPKNPSNQLTKSSLALAEFQDKLRSIDSRYPHISPPSPPNGLFIRPIPKSAVFNALINASATTNFAVPPSPHATNSKLPTGTASTTPTTASMTALTSYESSDDPRRPDHVPSVDSLCRLYQLIGAHHARLSMSVTDLVQNWLTRANLVQVGLVSPCQWISIAQKSVSLHFNWPTETPLIPKLPTHKLISPILFLVHGRIYPPACYDVWMDDEGPCFVRQVCLDQGHVQKPLNRLPFVTTLFPLHWMSPKPCKHELTIDFEAPKLRPARPTCIAIMIVAVSQSKSTTKESQTSTGHLNASTLGTQPSRGVQSSRTTCVKP